MTLQDVMRIEDSTERLRAFIRLPKEEQDKVLTPENMRLYDRQHAAVVEAVRRRDADAAAAAMVEEMAKARTDLLGAQSR